jgi:type VI secretion system protein ImpI
MRLILKIDNHSSLPDGGPLSVTVTGKRGIDIGRDQYLDWTLPDASRYISGKHCEVRFRDDAYLLFDVSSNGTFLNGAGHRMQSPHRLRSGDRLLIGEYIVAVTVDDAAEAVNQVREAKPASAQDLWGADFEAAPPIDPKLLRPAGRERPVHSDFLDHAMDHAPLPKLPRATDPFSAAVPDPRPIEPDPRSSNGGHASADPDADWAPVLPKAPPPSAPLTPPPRPRSITSSDRGVWGDQVDSGQPAPNPSDSNRAEQDFLRRFAVRAGLPETFFDAVDAGEKADEIADMLHCVIVELMQLLNARSEAKRLTRSAHQTMIQAIDNNPLKFSPTPEEALRLLLGPSSHAYLPGPRALKQSFADLKSHQLNSYSAMQAAVRLLANDLDPEAIDKSLPLESGISAMVASRRARLWDAYVARWRTKTKRHDDGLVDVFMLYFADCYDRISGNP